MGDLQEKAKILGQDLRGMFQLPEYDYQTDTRQFGNMVNDAYEEEK